MSDTTDVTSDVPNVADEASTGRRSGGTGLWALLLPELQSLAGSLGITGSGRMRKGDLIAAIQERQAATGGREAAGDALAGRGTPRARGAVAAGEPRDEVRVEVRADDARTDDARTDDARTDDASAAAAEPVAATSEGRPAGDAGAETAPADARPARRASRPAGPPEPRTNTDDGVAAEPALEPVAAGATGSAPESGPGGETAVQAEAKVPAGAGAPAEAKAEAGARDEGSTAEGGTARSGGGDRERRAPRGEGRTESRGEGRTESRGEGRTESRGEGRTESRNGRDSRENRESRDNRESRESRDNRESRESRDNRESRESRDNRESRDDDDDAGGRRGRRNRYRDRRRGRNERSSGEGEPQVSEDDVLIPVAGIIDVLDNYAFVRTNGYLAGSKDVYVSMAQVRKHGLRRGDAVTGAVRANRDGENRRDKYNPLVRLDTINGMDPEEARRRPEFYKLTPLYPQSRLRLETEPHILATRVIDLVMPIGKGQRALIVSPPKAGKTTVLQQVANAITTNNPECHLMVVLVDERPEEVTDMQRSVKGEVIASTFDRPPSDHTTVAELAIERAKRLVELGMDVVVMLDSITRLGRAYNNATPASGRIMSGGIDSTALYPPKRFLGAARNIENGGSLTIFATALVETGSVMDTVIFEEFKATGNAELKLDRKIADKRVFPAIDIDQSSTRKEEILLAPDELGIIYKLRKVLHSLESQAALDLLLDRLKESRTNVEFLMQIAKTTPGE